MSEVAAVVFIFVVLVVIPAWALWVFGGLPCVAIFLAQVTLVKIVANALGDA